jgi:chitinase
LPYAPVSLDISPDGKFAAVGHREYVTYIDLEKANIVKTIHISWNAATVILPNDETIYVFNHDNAGLLSVNIATSHTAEYNAQITSNECNYNAPLQIIFCISFDHFQLIILSNGTPEIPNLSTGLPQAQWPFLGKIWFSRDGTRVFSYVGNIYDEGLNYLGKLNIENYVGDLAVAEAINRILVVPKTRPKVGNYDDPAPNNHVYFVNYTTFQLEKTEELPGFTIESQQYKASGRFVFVNSRQNMYFVIVQADESAGLLNDFAVFTNALP